MRVSMDLRTLAMTAFFATVLASTAGCDRVREETEDLNDGLVGARRISTLLYAQDLVARAETGISPTNGTVERRIARNLVIGSMISDGIAKCTRFMHGLGSWNRGIDSFFDVTTGTLAALGAVFTPLNTVRALSAGAAISSGTKTSLQTNLYAQQVSPVLVDVIQRNYQKSVDDLVTKLKSSPDDYPVSLAVNDVLLMHNTCSLDYALMKLNKLPAEIDIQESFRKAVEEALSKATKKN